MAGTILLMTYAEPALESARAAGSPAEHIDKLKTLVTEFDAIGVDMPSQARSQKLVAKTREIHNHCQQVKVAAVQRIGGAPALPTNPTVQGLLDNLQRVRDMAALEATRPINPA